MLRFAQLAQPEGMCETREPCQRRDLFQEGQIPVGTALRVALGQILIQFGFGFFLGFRLINVRRSQYAREHF